MRVKTLERFTLFPMLMIWLGVCSVACGQTVESAKVFDEARRLEHDEQPQAAFLKYLTVPGGESAAATLARPPAREFLALLRERGAAIPEARWKLIEAELLLALRDKVGALAAYRDVATKIAANEQQGWEQGLLPRTEYFVEPPADANQWGGHAGAMPFTVGPGSHRDNWLLRRFIALETWDEARREFARVWQLHREATKPFFVRVPTYDRQGQQKGLERRVVWPTGFNGGGLQFVLDYSYFLQRQNDAEQARAVLIEAAMLIDMDRNPNHRPWGDPIPEGQPIDMPERPQQVAVVPGSASQRVRARLAVQHIVTGLAGQGVGADISREFIVDAVACARYGSRTRQRRAVAAGSNTVGTN